MQFLIKILIVLLINHEIKNEILRKSHNKLFINILKLKYQINLIFKDNLFIFVIRHYHHHFLI